MSTVIHDHQALDGWRTESMYTFGEAAHLANVSTTTVKNWLFGYTVRGRKFLPCSHPAVALWFPFFR